MSGLARNFAGTGALVRLALRRDRIVLPVWILVFAGIAVGSFAFGAMWTAVACTFASIAAVAAQVTQNVRSANGIAA
jgi:ABC-2 type transport system permease protein